MAEETAPEVSEQDPAAIAEGLMNAALGDPSKPWTPPVAEVAAATEEAEEEAAEEVVNAAADTEVVAEEATPAEEAAHPLSAFLAGGATEAKPIAVPKAVSEWFTKQGITDPASVLGELPKLRTSVASLQADVEKQKADLALYDGLDEEAKNVVRMSLAGENWKEKVLSRPSLDYTLPFEKQDKKAMLDLYAKGKVSEDDMEEYLSEDGDAKSKALVEAVLEKAELLYSKDKEDVTTYGAKRTAEIKAQEEKQQASLDASLAYVYSKVPGSQSYKDEITKAITGLRDHFFEKDGFTLKPTAAFDAWTLTRLNELTEAKVAKAKVETQNAANIDLLRRTGAKQASLSTKEAASEGTKTPKQMADELMTKTMAGPMAR